MHGQLRLAAAEFEQCRWRGTWEQLCKSDIRCACAETKSAKPARQRQQDEPAENGRRSCVVLQDALAPASQEEGALCSRGVAEELRGLTDCEYTSSGSSHRFSVGSRCSLSSRSSSLPSVFSRSTSSSGAFTDMELCFDQAASRRSSVCISEEISRPSSHRRLPSRRSSSRSVSHTDSSAFHGRSSTSSRSASDGDLSALDELAEHARQAEAEPLDEDDVIFVSSSDEDGAGCGSSGTNSPCVSGRISRFSFRGWEAPLNFHPSPHEPTIFTGERALGFFAMAVYRRCPLSRLQPEDVGKWVQAVDASLINCRWQEHSFLCVANVVMLHTIFQKAIESERARTHCELRGLVTTCLYVAYSYGGHEISYPLRPFAYTNDRTLFWEKCVRVAMHCSKVLLLINRDEDFYINALQDLLAN